ncbi:MAG: hypothetical protein V2I56_23595, partial [Desulfobacteraceae bacterium]|nr:hypothetical protein [Desulfobacteraceae bacterium]
ERFKQKSFRSNDGGSEKSGGKRQITLQSIICRSNERQMIFNSVRLFFKAQSAFPIGREDGYSK